MASNKDPWDILFEHRYDEALLLYRSLAPKREPNDFIPLAEEATALLCVGRLTDALDRFREANAIATRRSEGESRPYDKDIGAVLWLLGDRDAAVNTWHQAAQLISRGETKFADNVGGASEGLLLWYAAVTAKDVATKDYAVEYLANLANKPRIRYWPGPSVELVLGRITFQELLKCHWPNDDLDSILELSQSELLVRRELSQALFYFAAVERRDNREPECQRWMQQCASLANPVLVVEWYLARGECCPCPTPANLG